MTREEAITLIECSATELVGTLAETENDSAAKQLQRYIDAYDMAISALRAQQELESKLRVLESSDMFDKDGGEITHVETVTNRNELNEPLTPDELREAGGMICDDVFYAGKCPARTEDGQCVSKYPCGHKVEPPKPPTNADRIRAMSDEELAGFLMKLMGHAQCFAEGMFPYHPCPQNQNCKQCGIEWLQQPAENFGQKYCPDQMEAEDA